MEDCDLENVNALWHLMDIPSLKTISLSPNDAHDIDYLELLRQCGRPELSIMVYPSSLGESHTLYFMDSNGQVKDKPVLYV